MEVDRVITDIARFSSVDKYFFGKTLPENLKAAEIMNQSGIVQQRSPGTGCRRYPHC